MYSYSAMGISPFVLFCLPDGWREMAGLPQDQLMRAPWRFRELPCNISSSFVFIDLS